MTGRRIAAIALVAITLAGCSDDDDASPATSTTIAAPTTTEPTTTEPATTVAASTTTEPPTTPPTTSAPATASWEKVVPGGDCQCALGGEFSYYVHRGDPTKVVLYFEGGGACFSADTCRPDSGFYTTAVDIESQVAEADGIFDLTNPKNPLRDWSFVIVPYCTGDVFMGNKTNEYAPDLTIHHVGAVNAKAALDGLVATFPDVTRLLVTGESAGGIPAPLIAGDAHDALPAASITVLADGSGAYPDVPLVNAVIGAAWGTLNAVPPWPENAGVTAETWSIPGLFVRAGKHDPAIVFARHDYAFDGTQAKFAAVAGVEPSNLLSQIDTNEQQIEAAGVPLASYIAPGSDHTILHKPGFYTEAVNGVALVDWVTDLVDGTPVADVHCQECKTG
jgi:hypothetical protein